MTTDERRLPGIVPRWEIPGWGERFGVVAGITGRGDGPEPFDLGLWTAAPVGEVMARWRAFRASVPECPAQVLAHQIHGDRVLWHGGPAAGWTLHDGADGHATATPGLLLLVTVADCVPVYLLAPRTRTIALLHAGWRGTAAGILARGVDLLRAQSGEPADQLVVHLGVSISGPCYEVGAEVMAGVGEPHPGAGPWHLDIREVLARQAAELGVREVTRSGRCSARDAGDFFSHRRSRGQDGRMVAYLGIPSPPPHPCRYPHSVDIFGCWGNLRAVGEVSGFPAPCVFSGVTVHVPSAAGADRAGPDPRVPRLRAGGRAGDRDAQAAGRADSDGCARRRSARAWGELRRLPARVA